MRTTLYKEIAALDPNRENRLFTLLSPGMCGKKILLSGDEIVYEDTGVSLASMAASLPAENGIARPGGREAYQEILGREPRMTVFGGGYVAQRVIGIAKMCGYRVTAAEDREAFAAKAAEAGADDVLCGSTYEALFPALLSDPQMIYAVLTRGHSSDRICLKQALSMPHGYVGMIGSRRKNAAVMEALRAEGVPEELLLQVHAPIGLSIGARTPEEIAVSIMAEIIQVRSTLRDSYGFPKQFLQAILEAEDGGACAGEERILATIVGKEGSAPRDAGAKILIGKEGPVAGTIGGGGGEAEVILRAQGMLSEESGDATAQLALIDMASDPSNPEALICGGRIRVLLERI